MVEYSFTPLGLTLNVNVPSIRSEITQHTDVPKSVITKNHLPQFFDFEKSKLVEFMKLYYEWMEQFGPDLQSQNILKYNDVDNPATMYDIFSNFLANEFLKDFPSKTEIDQRVLIKHVKDFYRAKGSEDALKLLFKILYNDDIEITYPGEKILRASHGKWLIETSMYVTLLVSSIADISEYDFLVGVESNAVAKIQRIEQTILDDAIVIEIFFDSKNGDFIEGETVKSKLTGDNIAYIQTLKTYPGRYINTDGWLSSDMKLQDNYYYQEFSYVIKSSYPNEIYKDAVTTLAHPAGTLLFSEYLLNITIDNEIDFNDIVKEYTKQLTYIINFNEFIQLSLESDQTTGSYTSQYILIYEFVADDMAIDHPEYNYVTLTNTGEVANSYYLTSDNSFVDVVADDIIETVDDTTGVSYYAKVKSKISDSEVELYYEYPYDSSTVHMKLHRNDDKPKTELFMNVNTFDDVVENKIVLGDLLTYETLSTYSYEDIEGIFYDDMQKKKYITTTTQNFNDENIVKNSIIRIVNNINTDETYHFIDSIYTPKLMMIRDEYTSTPANDLNYQIINI